MPEQFTCALCANPLAPDPRFHAGGSAVHDPDPPFSIVWVGTTGRLSARIHVGDKAVAHVPDKGMFSAGDLRLLVERANAAGLILTVLGDIVRLLSTRHGVAADPEAARIVAGLAAIRESLAFPA